MLYKRYVEMIVKFDKIVQIIPVNNMGSGDKL